MSLSYSPTGKEAPLPSVTGKKRLACLSSRAGKLVFVRSSTRTDRYRTARTSDFLLLDREGRLLPHSPPPPFPPNFLILKHQPCPRTALHVQHIRAPTSRRNRPITGV